MKTITDTDRKLINAVVAEGMSRLPAGVLEKDLLVTGLLQALAQMNIVGMEIVFCGGTCLSKAHGLIDRMSEDIDFKVQLSEVVSRSARSQQLRQLKHDLAKHFVGMGFDVPADGVTARDENNYFSLALHYESAFPKVVSLRSEIQVEFSARPMFTPTQRLPIASMLEVSAGLPSQAFEMTCVSIEETLAEKVLSLLRRTAQMLARQSIDDFDPRLVRHLYDVHAIMETHPGIVSRMGPALFEHLVAEDAAQFSHQHPEFVEHPVAEMSGAMRLIKTDPMFRKHYDDFYFAHPYASWERGANENMNGLIRQFFPKKMRFDSITEKDIAFVMHRLNHRPRKCLGFKTPHEVFMNQLHLRHNAVALQT